MPKSDMSRRQSKQPMTDKPHDVSGARAEPRRNQKSKDQGVNRQEHSPCSDDGIPFFFPLASRPAPTANMSGSTPGSASRPLDVDGSSDATDDEDQTGSNRLHMHGTASASSDRRLHHLTGHTRESQPSEDPDFDLLRQQAEKADAKREREDMDYTPSKKQRRKSIHSARPKVREGDSDRSNRMNDAHSRNASFSRLYTKAQNECMEYIETINRNWDLATSDWSLIPLAPRDKNGAVCDPRNWNPDVLQRLRDLSEMTSTAEPIAMKSLQEATERGSDAPGGLELSAEDVEVAIAICDQALKFGQLAEDQLSQTATDQVVPGPSQAPSSVTLAPTDYEPAGAYDESHRVEQFVNVIDRATTMGLEENTDQEPVEPSPSSPLPSPSPLANRSGRSSIRQQDTEQQRSEQRRTTTTDASPSGAKGIIVPEWDFDFMETQTNLMIITLQEYHTHVAEGNVKNMEHHAKIMSGILQDQRLRLQRLRRS